MATLDNLLQTTFPASFNGIPFLFESDTMESGKQTVTHHYPYKTYAYTEELGQRLRSFKVKAIVTGDSYELRRDALIAALRINGTGVLIHHFYGILTVTCINFSVSHETTEIGLSRFDIDFEESYAGIFPSSVGTTISTITELATSLSASLNNDVSNNFTMTYPTNIQDSADKCTTFNNSLNKNIVNATNIDQNSLSSFKLLSNDFENNIYFYVQTPTALGNALTSLILSYNEISSDFYGSFILNASLFGFGSEDRYIDYNTIIGAERINNAKTINSVINAMYLILMYQNASLIDYDNDQQLIYVASFLEQKYQIFLNNNNFGSLLLDQIKQLRIYVNQYLDQLKININKVINVDVSQAPLTVLLYRYYENFDFQQEVINLNALKDTTIIAGNIKMVTEV